jgi:hypothetical protein
MAAPLVPVVIGGLLIWRFYRRLRRNIGQQPLRPGRIITSIVIFSLISVVFFVIYAQFPKILLGLAGGLLLGAGLGLVGLRLTKFEATEQGHFYTPNTHIGIGLSVLLAGRIIYRMFFFSTDNPAPNAPQAFQSPLTLFFFGLIAGYYLVYYIGLFVHTHDRK